MTRALKIVVAEDEPDIREYLHDVLTRLGHQVVAVTTGKELVEMARVGEPDLVVSDIRMPDMDGVTASCEVNREREVPVVLVSAFHDADVLERAVTDHVMAYLVKPVGEADIKVALAVAQARFAHYLEARREAADLRQALDDRKVIERAKGSLMGRLRVDEDEAFRRLRKHASDTNRKLVDVARAVLTAEDVFGQLDRL